MAKAMMVVMINIDSGILVMMMMMENCNDKYINVLWLILSVWWSFIYDDSNG